MNRREASRRASQPRLQGKKDATPFVAIGLDASQSSGRAEGNSRSPRTKRNKRRDSTMGSFVLTSLRSPSLAGAVGRQIQGRLGGITALTGLLLVPFSCFLGCQWDAWRESRFGPADEIYENA